MFSRAIGSYWGPMLYSVFATLLQGIFCLGSTHHTIIERRVAYLPCVGMIYDMNPFQMPKAFCIGERTGLLAQLPARSYDAVQTFVIYYSAWSLSGICGAFTFATSSSVLWPSFTKRPASSCVNSVQPSNFTRLLQDTCMEKQVLFPHPCIPSRLPIYFAPCSAKCKRRSTHGRPPL